MALFDGDIGIGGARHRIQFLLNYNSQGEVDMDRGILVSHKTAQKEFFISRNTPLHLLTALFKKAFHLAADVKGFRHPRGYSIPIQDIFNFNINQPFEILVEEENSDQRSRSETFSQKALTKRSGRKFPPHEKQLNEAKLYLDDFQFFMAEVTSRKTQPLCGIVFFNNKKNASYLGKKILRQLIYQFDQMLFYYALHPLKRHSNSILLGETLNFAVFKGAKLIHEREFPSNLSATEQIIGYLKLLTKKGEIPQAFDPEDRKQIRYNLIETNEQRSFDVKRPKDLELDIEPIPNRQQPHKTSAKEERSSISPIMKIESPIKSNQINQISFENDLYQPEWFTDGESLNRLEKSFLSALIRSGDQVFISFCHGLDLKNKSKEKLNIELIKVFLKDFINKKLANFTEQQRYCIELNQQNRQSYVFSLLLKLHKFGNIEDFIQNVNKHMETLLRDKHSYVELAREIEKRRGVGVIKLKKNEEEDEEKGDQDIKLKLICKQQGLNSVYGDIYNKIANSFHKSSSILVSPSKIPTLPKQFTESEKAIIIESINKKDPFLIENYIASKWPKKKFQVFKPPIVRKFLEQNNKRYGRFRNFPFNEQIKKKLTKLEHFNSLMYYLYKQRTINRKQKISFFYLYIWSDLNLLGCFELYLLNRNLEDCIETLFTIDYTYYLEDRYGIDSAEVENFTVDIELQLIILFLLSDHIENISQKTTIEKFIRAGDNSFMEALTSSKDEKELVEQVLSLVEQKQKTLQVIEREAETEVKKSEKKKKQMKSFVESIQPVHFKQLKDTSRVLECIDLEEPVIHGIFQVYFLNGEVVDWIESFKIYLQYLEHIHMKAVLSDICNRNNIDFKRLMLCRTDLVMGAFEVHLKLRDEAETVDTIQRIIMKQAK